MAETESKDMETNVEAVGPKPEEPQSDSNNKDKKKKKKKKKKKMKPKGPSGIVTDDNDDLLPFHG